jgi:hypothetical protein
MTTLEMDDKQVSVEPPRLINWIPNQLGWHYSIFRKSFKKTPMLKIFKRFLTVESEIVSDKHRFSFLTSISFLGKNHAPRRSQHDSPCVARSTAAS